MKVCSFFAGCGGLDLGFKQAGFDVIWANEYDTTIHPTYWFNHPDTLLNVSDIRNLKAEDIPNCDGFIGGPPCQSWSVGGSMKGLEDDRGKLFLDYIRIIKAKQPMFFVIENVAGIISDRHFKTFRVFLSTLGEAGYCVKFSVMNSADYGVPQDRIRVFIVGIRKNLSIEFIFPEPMTPSPKHITLRRAIGDINEQPRFYDKEPVSQDYGQWWNHDCYSGPFDKKYMARNRLRKWDEVSFTIQAQGRNAPLHPQAPPMIFISSNERRFDANCLELYRRLSIRECARIQTFPDSFHFIYSNVQDGYKMVGNAVPPRLAKHLATALQKQLVKVVNTTKKKKTSSILVGYYRSEDQLRLTKEKGIYYVRTGFRPGAMQIPPGSGSPEYLLLHKNNNYELFRLKRNNPVVMNRNELEELGFKPHGDVYLSFCIDEAVGIEQISFNDEFLRNIKNTTTPFITYLNREDQFKK